MSFLSRLFGSHDDSSMSATAFVEGRVAGAPVIDVRTPGEFAAVHIEGAVNVDVMSPSFDSGIGALDLPADSPIYVYCRSGNRSGQAVRRLQQLGYSGAVNIGGLETLKSAGAPTS